MAEAAEEEEEEEKEEEEEGPWLFFSAIDTAIFLLLADRSLYFPTDAFFDNKWRPFLHNLSFLHTQSRSSP